MYWTSSGECLRKMDQQYHKSDLEEETIYLYTRKTSKMSLTKAPNTTSVCPSHQCPMVSTHSRVLVSTAWVSESESIVKLEG